MARKQLPANLYENLVKGKKYYRYKMPDGAWRSLGDNKALAVGAAKQLNERLYFTQDLVEKVIAKGPTINETVEWFMANRIANMGYAKTTVENYQLHMNKLTRKFGKYPVDAVSVKDMSDYMDTMTNNQAMRFRQMCTHFFRAAIAKGLRKDNPAEVVLKPIITVERLRLSLEAYKWIHEHAEPWMQNIMDLGLLTLQRRVDLIKLRKEDIKDGYLYVVQEKTKKYDTGYLAIKIGPALSEVLKRCEEYPMKGPTIIRRRPVRTVPFPGQVHISQPSPEQVSRTFTELSKQCPYHKKMTAKQIPTFHEIRALGIKLYKDAGINPQHLAGHATERMTSNYDSRHEDIRWNQVEANLELPNV